MLNSILLLSKFRRVARNLQKGGGGGGGLEAGNNSKRT